MQPLGDERLIASKPASGWKEFPPIVIVAAICYMGILASYVILAVLLGTTFSNDSRSVGQHRPYTGWVWVWAICIFIVAICPVFTFMISYSMSKIRKRGEPPRSLYWAALVVLEILIVTAAVIIFSTAMVVSDQCRSYNICCNLKREVADMCCACDTADPDTCIDCTQTACPDDATDQMWVADVVFICVGTLFVVADTIVKFLLAAWF